MKPRCACGCSQRSSQRHHVVYQQELRRIWSGGVEPHPHATEFLSLPALLAEPANLIWLSERCHAMHHARRKVIPLRRLPDTAIDFAFDLMGPRAAIYLESHYAGTDRRITQRGVPPMSTEAPVAESTFRQKIDQARAQLDEPDVATTPKEQTPEELPPIENVEIPGLAAVPDEQAESDTSEVQDIVDAATEPEQPEAPEIVEAPRVDGTTQFGFDLGGKAPSQGTLQIVSGKLQSGYYTKGDRVWVQGWADIREINQKDKVDRKSGIVSDCAQGHVAVLVEFDVLSADEKNAAA